jgi:hypothetical protein
LAVFQVLATFGPGVDSHSNKSVTDLWLEDGIYDLHHKVMHGPSGIEMELDGEWHQSLLEKGSAHVMSMPHVVINGDEAVATCHSRLYRCEGDAFRVISCSANRWELVRDGGRWRVKNRVSRRLNGTKESRDIFAGGVNANWR